MRLPEVTLRQLSCFTAVAAAGSFTGAAVAIHTSQSVLSRTIRDLEGQLKVRLFNRTTRHVGLTRAGQELLEIITPVLSAHESGLKRFAAFTSAQSGTLAVATLPSLAATILPKLIQAFMVDHPDIDFEIIDGAADEVAQQLKAGNVELAVTTRSTLPEKYHFTPMIREQFFGVAHENHRWAGKTELSWSDFHGEDVIAARRGTSIRQITDIAFDYSGVMVGQRFNPSTVATIGGLVRSGIGVVALPALEVQGFGLFDLVRVPIRDDHAFRIIGLARTPDRELSPVASQFVGFVAHTRLPSLIGTTAIGKGGIEESVPTRQEPAIEAAAEP